MENEEKQSRETCEEVKNTRLKTQIRQTVSSPETVNSIRTESVSDWSRFSEWIRCICVVTFDLELGQAIEVIYPEKFAPSEKEKTNICYLAFPDSNSGCMGDTQFHVRLRLAPDTNCHHHDGKNKSPTSLSIEHKRFNAQCNAAQKSDKAHYWGFVYFRQRKEASLPRGYFQKSFIILTRLPFFNLFNEILSQLAPMYFLHGLSVIESACSQVAYWPPLVAGEFLRLPLFEIAYQIIIPQANSKSGCNSGSCSSTSRSNSKNLTKTSDNENYNLENQQKQPNCNVYSILQTKNISSVNEIDVFRSLSCVISNVYTLWELVLTAEPIVVIGSSPADTSHMVQSLVSLIAPLEYCAEARPYFTIHDSEFKEFTREHQAQSTAALPPSIIIGVTNPFFVKLLKDWPHMIRIPHSNNFNLSSHLATPTSATSNISNSSLTATVVNKRIATATDNSVVLSTKYKPFLKKDKVLIKKIVLGVNTKRPEHVQSALLRRNLLELTQSFMIPLERYMASLMPLQRDISPFKSAPSPNQFKQDDFLATLDQSGPHLTSPLKGNWKGLYQRFFNSPNFKGWYETRHKELQRTLQSIQLQALSGADLNQWAQGKQEVEIIDMIIKLKQKLNLSSIDTNNSNLVSSNEELIAGTQTQLNETRKKLLYQIESMKQSLPDDLKTILFDT
ncbi:protein DENND6A [Eupeodes corollae]|uniref:protein DENND6A n=1 Tax=Eupeodes corollae TaxID=290404 RepID=UPI00249111B7|nr:protein DENND6A [Eupeodes corollae]XP_055922027.1 protein DENND6A [Eupeodes corollae]